MKGKRIVLGFDSSPEARDALRLADELAALEGAQIIVVKAYEIPTLPGTAIETDPDVFAGSRATIDMALEQLSHRTVQTRIVASSSAARALHDVAEAEGAEVIVVGSSHRAGFGRVFPGNVATRLLHGAPCAVAVAPRNYARREHFGVGLVGVGFDGGDESRLAVAWARRLAVEAEARLRIISVLPDSSDPAIDTELHEKLREDSERLLADVVTFAGQPNAKGERVCVQRRLIEGPTAVVLADQGVELDMLVVGSRGYGPVMRTIVGGVSEKVIRRAPCPVVVVPRGERTFASHPATVPDRGTRLYEVL